MFAAAFAVYALGASPALGWYDAPEFVAASVGLGVPHSPGHPLPTFAGAAGTLAPVGDLALRVNLVSALAGAAACAALAAAGHGLLERAGVRGRVASALAAAAALGFAGSHALWSNAVRAEVYALTAALVIGMLAAALTWEASRAPRWLVLAGLLGGLALATHHLVAVLALLPAAAFVLVRPRAERPSPALAACTALAGTLGLAAFLYLPVRSAAGPALDWGAPRTAGAFVWTVSGAVFADNAGGGHVSTPVVDAAQTVAAIGGAAGAPLALLGVLGAIVLLRDPRRRRAGALLVGVIALGAAGRALFGFDPDTPDDHGYVAAAAAALCLLGLAGAAEIAVAASTARARLREPALAALAALGVVWACGRVALGWESESLAHATASDDVARLELEHMPPRALLIDTYYQTQFRTLALQAVERARPDVTVLHRGLLTLPGEADASARRHPDLAALVRAPLSAAAPSPLDALDRVAASRPVLFELDPSLDAAIHPRLVSLGRFARYAVRPPGPRELAAAERTDAGRGRAGLDRVRREHAAVEDLELRRQLGWLDLARLDHHCTIGRRAAAQEALERLWELFPDDVMLEERAARCGLR